MSEEDRLYWNMQVEPFLNTPQMKELQLQKLKVMLNRHHAHAPFQRKRLEEAGIDIDQLDRQARSVDDLLKRIPVYDKQAYREHVEACGGDLVRLMEEEIPVSVDDLVLVNSTTGTTGEPTPYPLSMKDIFDVWGETMCRGLWRGGLRRHDRVLHCFALSMVIAGTGTP